MVNVTDNTADPPLPPKGAVTGMLAIANRNVVYVIEGGYQIIYDTTTDTPAEDAGHLPRRALRHRAGGPVGKQPSAISRQLSFDRSPDTAS